ncbi:MAG TPA: hypothetical protein VGM68_00535 [Rhizomicrobium sp.]|jgi:hypothetical protein
MGQYSARRLVWTVAMGLTLFGAAPLWAGNLAAVPMTMTPIYMNTSFNLMMIDATRRRAEIAYGPSRESGSSRSPISRAPAGSESAAIADFTVPSNPAVSAQVKAAFLDAIRAHNSPEVTAGIADIFQRKPVRAAYLEAASPYDITDRDLRDVVAAYLTVAWMTANKAPLPTREQVQGLRHQVADDLAKVFAAADARTRQTIAEQMMYQIVSTIYARQDAEKAGDSQTLQRMADQTSTAFRTQKLDLRAIALTDQGFSPR